MTNWHGNGGGWGSDAPVFGIDFEDMFGDECYPYPDVWITVQAYEPTETSTGRNCVGHYVAAGDHNGWQALRYGGAYYEEGMSCDPDGPYDEHEKRQLCFEAAEILYLHAASKGNPYGHLNLGYIYSYDRCKGKYWEKLMTWETDEDLHTPYPHLEKAVEHFQSAAEAGIAEACYKLGDMLRDGRGCDADLDEAYRWFAKAYELGKNDAPVIWGSAALRLGRAHEEGEGCEQLFPEACSWYERATTGLSIAVRGGDDWYRGALRHAEAGLARTRQELDGSY